MLTITVDDSAFRATMRRLQEGMSDLTPVMERIGGTLEANIQNRFETRTDPNGRPWKPWAKQTLATYPFAGTEYAKGDEGPGNGKLLDRYGTMLRGLNYQADSNSVRVGFAMPYASYHEFGTKKMPRRGMLMGNPEAGTLGQADERAVIDILNGFLQDLAK
jgi:phage virion morphogenesis protein